MIPAMKTLYEEEAPSRYGRHDHSARFFPHELFDYWIWAGRPSVVMFCLPAYDVVGPADALEMPKNRPHAIPLQESATCDGQKSATCVANKSATYTRGGVRTRVLSVISTEDLGKLLESKGWRCWCSRSRIASLVMIVCDLLERSKRGMLQFSRDRARSLCASMPKEQAGDAPIDGLHVLVKLGLLSHVGRAHWQARHRSLDYCFTPKYKTRPPWSVDLLLTAKEKKKWDDRNFRATSRFEARNPIIEVVREIAATRLRFSEDGLNEICRIKTSDSDLIYSADRCRKALHDTMWTCTLDRQGTLHTPVSGCPKGIRKFLEMDRQRVVEVDISGAHLVALTRVYDPAFLARYKLSFDQREIDAERAGLISQIESGDVYQILPGDRDQNKIELLTALNIRLKIQLAMKITRALLPGRSILRSVFEAVKKRDHRILSWWLQRWVSDITNASLLSLHADGIPSIPIVDSLLVRHFDEARARKELSRRILESTGIYAMVGGIRWSPEDAFQQS